MTRKIEIDEVSGFSWRAKVYYQTLVPLVYPVESFLILLSIKVFANVSQNSFHVESRELREKQLRKIFLNKRTHSRFWLDQLYE